MIMKENKKLVKYIKNFIEKNSNLYNIFEQFYN